MTSVLTKQGRAQAAGAGAAGAAVGSVVAALAATGVVARVAPLFDRGGRLLHQFPTEDGYLMLTIARNLAMGRGMSIAGGTIPTNGTQPLATFAWAACFALAGGDRARGVALVLGLSVLVASLAAWWLYRLGREVLGGWPPARAVAALAASAWYASSIGVQHTMNCLETGIYVLAVLGCARLFARWSADRGDGWPIGRCVALGLVLGLAFWARNDAVFLVASACLVHVAGGLGRGGAAARRRLLETFAFGATSVVVAAPWLVANYARFGSIMPISGIAESHDARFAGNLHAVPTKLVEYLTVVGAIPWTLEGRRPTRVAATVLLLASLPVAAAAWRRSSGRGRCLLALVAAYGALLCGYYGLLFGAPHFVGRYLMPLSPFLALGTATALAAGWERAPRRARPALAGAAAVAAIAVAVLTNARDYAAGTHHMHSQVVRWVEGHVPERTWVGAIQTGTLGFFHDRTINLDGKVNPYALEAKLARRIPRYVIESPIAYLVDWAGIADWARLPGLRDEFELIVRDERADLAVLRRRSETRRETPHPRGPNP